jgi:hypothetical protein
MVDIEAVAKDIVDAAIRFKRHWDQDCWNQPTNIVWLSNSENATTRFSKK